MSEGVWALALETPTLPPATATNTVVFAGDRLLVVEPATPHAGERARLDALLDERITEGRALAGLCLTHHHIDHVGYAQALRERTGAPIFAHAETAARLPFAVDVCIDEGWRMDLGRGVVVEALHTPGHAPGHLVFWEQGSAVAHVGDLVAGEGTILIDPSDGGDMARYLESLRRMAARVGEGREADAPAPRFVPAHGETIEDPLAVLERYIGHRLAREDIVRRAILEGGARDFEAILATAYADTPRALWPIAALSLEAHLGKLVGDEELAREGEGRAARYAPRS
nr:MBL fold metallo-hydrolase [Pseudenhygromyxa sp. WMMC2535]